MKRGGHETLGHGVKKLPGPAQWGYIYRNGTVGAHNLSVVKWTSVTSVACLKIKYDYILGL
jgi:hypothetical protein